MTRARRRFGPLFYLTVALAVILLASLPFWEAGIQQFRAWKLSSRLHDPDEAVRRDAAEGLVQLGPTATWWVDRALQDPDPRARALACSVAGRTITDAKEPAEALLAAVHDADASVRAAAVGQLERVITRSGSSGPSGVREKAFRSLGAALEDEAKDVRMAAVWSLWNLGPSAKPAMGDLERALTGADKSLRPYAGGALLRIDPSSTRPGVIAAMSALLSDQSIRLDHFRLVRVLTTAQGEDATAAMLAPLLHHPDPATRSQAIFDLITHCNEAKVLKPLLIDALTGADVGVREEAAIHLLKHEPSMESKALELLAGQIVDPSDGSYLLWDLIRKIRGASPAAMAPLARVLVERLSKTQKPECRVNAIIALSQIGREARPAISLLLDASKSDDGRVATRALEALVKIDPPAAATRISSLLDWTTPAHERDVRLIAMRSLGDLGPAAWAAIPALLKLADEDDLPVSAGAIEAISRIDPARGAIIKRAIEQGAVRSPDE